MSLVRTVQLDTRNEPIVPLAERVLVGGRTLDGADYGINVDAPYQRESVWGDERRRNLIRSLFMGLPIGALIFNERKFPEWRVCIDGKQRLLAVRAFVEGRLYIPADWLDETEQNMPRELFDPSKVVRVGGVLMVNWHGLTVTGQRVFDSVAHVATHTAQLWRRESDPLALEAELFDLINYGGVPQGERDADRSAS